MSQERKFIKSVVKFDMYELDNVPLSRVSQTIEYWRQQYGDDALLCFDIDWGGSAEIWIEYEREETDEDLAARLKREKKNERERERRRLKVLNAIKEQALSAIASEYSLIGSII